MAAESRKRHRLCFCRKCGIGGKRRRYETAARHERLFPPALGEAKAPHVPSVPQVNMVHEEKEVDVDEIARRYVVDVIDKQMRRGEKITSVMDNMKIMRSRNLAHVLDNDFQSLLPRTYYSALKCFDSDVWTPTKIPMCVNNCVLYRKRLHSAKRCPECNEDRYPFFKSQFDSHNDM